MLLTTLALTAASSLSLAPQEGYRLPPPEVVAIIDAPATPGVRFSPDGQWLLIVERDALPSIAEVSRRMLRLAGLRIDPALNSRYVTGFDRGLLLRARDADEAVRVPLPDGARLASVSWSHDSTHFAYTLATDSGSALYAATVDAPAQPRELHTALNTIFGGPSWMPDGRTLVCRTIPADRPAEPEAPAAPLGPNVQSTSGETSPLRTYQDLLENEHDAQLFEHYGTSQIVLLSADGGPVRELGEPGLYSGVQASPDGERLLVTSIERPFSYLMPYYSFPQTLRIWSVADAESTLFARIAMAENVPIGGVRMGPRQVQWRPDTPASLVWVEALDGGDPEREVPHRDRWMSASASGLEGNELLRVEQRASGIGFLQGIPLVLSTEYDRDRRWTRTLLHDLEHPDAQPHVLDDRSYNDRYADPGRLLRISDENGQSVVRVDDGWVYRSGRGATPEGLLPFLDRLRLDDLESERLWRCSAGHFEELSALLPALEGSTPAFITRHESPESPPNYFLRTPARDEARALTSFPDPTPQLRGIEKHLVTYERADGVPLSATLYLPPDYEPGTRLPLLVWAYPREFNDPKTAGQISSSPARFTRIGGLSHLMLLTQGYAIMDGATMPVIGDPETMNDTFIEQIVAAAQAAIDVAVEMGVADRERVVVGGHSYGAFMTANLLAHSDLFVAGVARSGAYNRSLTPFGFQSERRTIWEAPEAYIKVSPFFHADGIEAPLLLIHGELDNNSGTFPMQSRRLFQAIKGNGGTARLVMLPSESHGYRARESVLHVHAETIEWFDRYTEQVEASEASAGDARGGR